MTETSWSELRKTTSVGFETYPTGTYNFFVKKATAGRTKKGDKDQMNLNTVIVDGAYAGKPVFVQLTVSDDNPVAMSILFQNLAVLGVGEEFLAASPTTMQIAAALVGQYFTAELNHREWPPGSGAVRNNLGIFKKFEGTPPIAATTPVVPEVAVPTVPAAPVAETPVVPVAPAETPAPAPVVPTAPAETPAPAPVTSPAPVEGTPPTPF